MVGGEPVFVQKFALRIWILLREPSGLTVKHEVTLPPVPLSLAAVGYFGATRKVGVKGGTVTRFICLAGDAAATPTSAAVSAHAMPIGMYFFISFVP